MAEHHTLLSGLLECVSVDLNERGSVVGLKPKFMGLFQFMGAKSKTPMRLKNNSSEPDEGSELSLTGWWRLGRVELHQQHGLAVLVAISWAGGLRTLGTFSSRY